MRRQQLAASHLAASCSMGPGQGGWPGGGAARKPWRACSGFKHYGCLPLRPAGAASRPAHSRLTAGRVLGREYTLSNKELATAPRSVLAEAASFGAADELVDVKTWRDPSADIFQAAGPACLRLVPGSASGLRRAGDGGSQALRRRSCWAATVPGGDWPLAGLGCTDRAPQRPSLLPGARPAVGGLPVERRSCALSLLLHRCRSTSGRTAYA